MKRFSIIIMVSIFLGGELVFAQTTKVVFYNVENLFDVFDDPRTEDDEFLPDGAKHWTPGRFYNKLVRIYKTLIAFGEGEVPAVIGLCEIENRGVLNKLVYDTPLKKTELRIIHRDSEDARGIDVALLYRPELFTPDSVAWISVPLPEGETTREILLARGILWGTVRIYFFVNHWPSRWGGAVSSSERRKAAAIVLSESITRLSDDDPNANIVIMGDFNDEPGDESLQVLNEIASIHGPGPGPWMVNLASVNGITGNEGTIKHQGNWFLFDQVLVSNSMLYGTGGIQLAREKLLIFGAGFLLEPDEAYLGSKPFRTYTGPYYHNGFSDHLPVGIIISKSSSTR